MYNYQIKKILSITIAFTMLLAVLVLGIDLYKEKKYKDNINQLEKIDLIGTYHIEGKEESHPLPKDGKLGLSGNNNVTIEGHFNKDIPINKQLIMRIDNMKVKIFINEEELYSFGQKNTFLSNAHSAGNLWDSVVSPGIKTSDTIKIELYNVYTDRVETAYSRFLNNIYSGYESALISQHMHEKLFNTCISLFIICLGFMSIGIVLIIIRLKKPVLKLLCFGGLCISNGTWCFLDFNIQNYLFPYPVFNNSLDILSLLFTIFFLISYFALYLESKCRYILFGLSGTIIATILIMTILQFLGIKDYYDCLYYIQSACIVYIPIIVGCMFYEKKKLKNNELNKLLLPTIILAVGMMGDTICNMLQIIPYINWFRLSYLIFLTSQFMLITEIIRKPILESTRIEVLEELVYEDALTGVRNRTAYLNKVECIKSNLDKDNPINVFVFDINNLKIVNDTLGHEYGDLLIKTSANILLKVFNKEDVYRIGGDEFVVILESKNEINYIKLIDKLEDEIKSNNYYSSQPPISMAYGVAIYDANKDTSFEDVFSRADKEMYANKVKIKKSCYMTKY